MEIKRIQSPEGTNQIQAEEQIKQTGTAATGDDIAPFQPDFLQTVDATLQPAGSRSQLVNQLKSLMSEILQSTLGSNTQVKELTAGVDRMLKLLEKQSEIQATQNKIESERQNAQTQFLTAIAIAASTFITGGIGSAGAGAGVGSASAGAGSAVPEQATDRTTALKNFTNQIFEAIDSIPQDAIKTDDMHEIKKTLTAAMETAISERQAADSFGKNSDAAKVFGIIGTVVMVVAAIVVATFTFGAAAPAASILLPVLEAPEVVSAVQSDQRNALKKLLEELLQS